jgi:hypothetical protein
LRIRLYEVGVVERKRASRKNHCFVWPENSVFSLCRALLFGL